MKLSRTTWLVITIFGLAAFIVGGGVALVNDGTGAPSASNVPEVTVSSSPPARESPPSSIDPSASLAQDEGEGGDQGHGENGKAKGHDKEASEEHGKAKGHQGDQGDQD